MLTSTEFTNGLEELGYYDDWDVDDDGFLDEEEFSEGRSWTSPKVLRPAANHA